MNISISNIAWDHHEEHKVASVLTDFEISGIEIAPTKIWPAPILVENESIREYRDFWFNKGFAIVAMQSLLFGRADLLMFKNKEILITMKEYLTKIIELAGKLGVGKLVFGSPKNRVRGELNKNEAMQVAIPFFYAIGEVAKKNNVEFCIEPNPPQYGCDFITNTSEGVELVKEVGHPAFRLHLDAAALTLVNDNYVKSLELSMDYLSHFHISEPNLGLIGGGITRHKEIANILKDLNYNKWVSIEMKSSILETNIDSVKRALEFVVENYRN